MGSSRPISVSWQISGLTRSYRGTLLKSNNLLALLGCACVEHHLMGEIVTRWEHTLR